MLLTTLAVLTFSPSALLLQYSSVGASTTDALINALFSVTPFAFKLYASFVHRLFKSCMHTL